MANNFRFKYHHFFLQKNQLLRTSANSWPSAMDPNPTPFPGKRRPSGNPSKIEADQFKSKPKRTFGRNLNTNIPIERAPQKNLGAKPWKPSGVSKNLQKPLMKFSVVRAGSYKKCSHVSFLDLRSSPVDESGQVFHEDSSIYTPDRTAHHPVVPKTPYQSAEKCGKCSSDRIESSFYWISQIKISEATGKHFVSAAFFRLAMECRAQPFVSLQNELKRYRDRHGVAFSEQDLWDDLCRDYGLTIPEQTNAFIDQFNSKCAVDEGILENSDADIDDPEERIMVKHFEDEMVNLLSPSMESGSVLWKEEAGDLVVGSSDLLKKKNMAEE